MARPRRIFTRPRRTDATPRATVPDARSAEGARVRHKFLTNSQCNKRDYDSRISQRTQSVAHMPQPVMPAATAPPHTHYSHHARLCVHSSRAGVCGLLSTRVMRTFVINQAYYTNPTRPSNKHATSSLISGPHGVTLLITCWDPPHAQHAPKVGPRDGEREARATRECERRQAIHAGRWLSPARSRSGPHTHCRGTASGGHGHARGALSAMLGPAPAPAPDARTRQCTKGAARARARADVRITRTTGRLLLVRAAGRAAGRGTAPEDHGRQSTAMIAIARGYVM